MSLLNFRTTKVHHFTSQVLQHLQYNLDPASLPIYLSIILNQFNSASVSFKYLHFNTDVKYDYNLNLRTLLMAHQSYLQRMQH